MPSQETGILMPSSFTCNRHSHAFTGNRHSHALVIHMQQAFPYLHIELAFSDPKHRQPHLFPFVLSESPFHTPFSSFLANILLHSWDIHATGILMPSHRTSILMPSSCNLTEQAFSCPHHAFTGNWHSQANTPDTLRPSSEAFSYIHHRHCHIPGPTFHSPHSHFTISSH